jgi:hypothetical protein
VITTDPLNPKPWVKKKKRQNNNNNNCYFFFQRTAFLVTLVQWFSTGALLCREKWPIDKTVTVKCQLIVQINV